MNVDFHGDMWNMMLNKKLGLIFVVFILVFGVSSVSASDFNLDNGTQSPEINNVTLDEIGYSDNLKVNDDSAIGFASLSDETEGVVQSDEIIVEDWDDLQYYCSLKDKDYVLRLKENTSYYPLDPSDSAYQIVINNNVTIKGNAGAYIGDTTPNSAAFEYTAIVVRDNSGVGLHLDGVHFKWISTNYFADGIFLQMAGNVNNTIENCVFDNINTNIGHSVVVHIKRGDLLLKNCSFINITTDFGCVDVYDPLVESYPIHTTARLLAENCYFENNYARTESSAIINCGVAVVKNCIFIKNRSFWWAGALHTGGGANTTIYDSMFEDNVAGWNGGALYTYCYLQIYNTTFKGNNCTTNNGGGAIGACKYKTEPHIYIDGCLFENNENLCWSLDDLSTSGTGRGGAISVMDGGTFEVHNSVFIKNAAAHGSAICAISAAGYGSPDVIIEGNSFINHTRAGDVLDIRVDETILVLRDNYFLNNTIEFSSFDLVSYNPNEEEVTFHVRASLVNPSNYDADILDKSEYDVYVNGSFVKRVVGSTFSLDVPRGDVCEVYVVSCINNLQSNVLSVGVPKEYIYVSKSRGDNSNSGLSRDAPVKTLQRAINLARNTQNILVMDGSFEEYDLFVSYDLTISAEDGVEFVSKNLPHFLFDATGATLTLKNFKIHNLGVSGDSNVIFRQDSGLIVLDNCSIYNNNFSKIIEADSLEIVNCVFENNSGVISTNGLIMSNSLFVNCSSDSSLFNVHSSGSVWQISDCSFANNVLGGSVLDYSTSTSKTLKVSSSLFDGNVVVGGYCSCVLVDGVSSANIQSCLFVNNNVNLPVVYKRSSRANLDIKDSVFLNNSLENIVGADIGCFNNIDIDYNWWGNTIENMDEIRGLNSSLVNNWIFLSLTTNNTRLECDEDALVCFAFNVMSVDGAVSVYDASAFPRISLALSVDNATIDGDSVDVVGGDSYAVLSLTGFGNALLNASYNVVSSFIVFNFTKSIPNIDVAINDVDARENASVAVNLPVNAGGDVSVRIINSAIDLKEAVNGSDLLFELPVLLPGTYEVLIDYSGDDIFENIVVNKTLTVNKLKSGVDVGVGEIICGEDIVLTICVLDDATGNVTVNINNNELVVVKIDNSTFSYVVKDFNKGENIVNVTYCGDDIYLSSSDVVVFEAGKLYSSINIEVDDIDYHENATVKLTFDSNATGNVSIRVDDKITYGVLENGMCTLSIPGLSAGTKTLFVDYCGDENYYRMSNSTEFKIRKIDATFTIDVADVKVGSDVNILISFEGEVTGNVSVKVANNESIRHISRVGSAVFIMSGLKVGNYTIQVQYNGDDNYNAAINSTSFEVIAFDELQWPMDGFADANNGVSPYEGFNKYGVAWILSNGENINGNIAIDSRGNLYFADNNHAYSYAGNMSLIWDYEFWSGDLVPGLAISRDVIIVPKSGDKLYFINQSTGSVYNSNVYQGSSAFVPVVDENANVYITSELQVSTGGYALVVVPYSGWIGGGLIKTVDIGKSKPTSAPVVVDESHVVIATEGGLIIVDVIDNSVLGTFTDIVTSSRPIVGCGNIIYCLLNDSVVALDINTKLWRADVSDVASSFILDDENGYLYVALGSCILRFDVIDGKETVLCDVGDEISSGLLMSSNGFIYLGSVNGTFSVLDTDGCILNQMHVDGTLAGRPVMDENGVIYAKTTDNRIIALNGINYMVSGLNVTVNNLGRGNVEVLISSPNNVTGVVAIIVDGVACNLTLDNASAKYDAVLSVGEHNITVNYSGDDVYAPFTVSDSVRIDALNTHFDNIIIRGENISAILIDDNCEIIAGANILYSVNGVDFNTSSGVDGSITINGLSDCLVAIEFMGEGVLQPCSISINMEKSAQVMLSSVFVGDDFKQYVCDYAAGERGGWYKLQLKDTNGNILAGKQVSISYNGVLVNKTTDNNGLVGLQVSLKKAGTYGFVFTFLGDDNYAGCMAVHKATILKKSTRIVVKAKTFKAKAKTKKYSVTLKTIKGLSANGKVYLKAGKKITLKLNGKTYTAKTNSKGKATFKLKITKKGKFTAKITFAGDNSMYKKSTAKAKITIK